MNQATTTTPANISYPVRFQAGGALDPDSSLYIERQADRELLQHCLNGEYVFLLNTRQVGKSSLIYRTAQHLRQEKNICSVVISLQDFGKSGVTQAAWLRSVVSDLEEKLEMQTDVGEWWNEQPPGTDFYLFSRFFHKVVLAEVAAPLVIFIDEIDILINFTFKDDFFTVLRGLHDDRQAHPELSRLSFVLAGSATPDELISDPRQTPFNIARMVELADFLDEREAAPLLAGFDLPMAQSEKLLARILNWTGGHPYLTQRVCQAIMESDLPLTEKSAVDRVVKQVFLNSNLPNDNLSYVRRALLERPPQALRGGILSDYFWIRVGFPPIRIKEQSPVHSYLKVSGVVRRRGGYWQVRNRIYEQVFDWKWLLSQQPLMTWWREAPPIAKVLRGAVSLLLVLLLGAVIIGFNQAREMSSQAQILQSLSLASASQITVDKNPMGGLLLAIEAIKVKTTPVAYRTLYSFLLQPPLARPVSIYEFGSSVSGATWSVNGTQKILTWSTDGAVRVWDVARGEDIISMAHEGSVGGAVWNADESKILTWSNSLERGLVQVWDAATGEEKVSMVHKGSVGGLIWRDGEIQSLLLSPGETEPILDFEVAWLARRYVSGATWNADESKILTWSEDGRARVWDAATGEKVVSLIHDASVGGAIWNADESLILTWSDDQTSRVWDTATGEEVTRLVHNGSVNGAIWNADESLILTWSDDWTSRVWDTATGEEVTRLVHDGSVNGAIWNANESQILTWSNDGTARVWDAATGKEIEWLTYERWYVSGATWNADESQILTLSNGLERGLVRVWDAATGEEKVSLNHDSYVGGAIWNADESQILTWSHDGTARVWDANTGEERVNIIHDGSVNGAIWNTDESQILTWSFDGTVRVWDLTTSLSLVHDGQVSGAIWNADESQILTWSHDGTARVWDANTGEERVNIIHDSSVNGAIWNTDESQILTWSFDGTVRVWDEATSEEIISLAHKNGVEGAIWNVDESMILTWSADGTARMWDAATSKEVVSLVHDGPISSAIWNADESMILTRSTIGLLWGQVRVWDAITEKETIMLDHDGGVGGAIWNADESQILTWNRGTTRVWDVTTGEEIASVVHSASVEGAIWNVDESMILTWSADGTARVWDAATSEEIVSLIHDGPVRSAIWNADESMILTRSNNSLKQWTVRVWDTATGEEIINLIHDEPVPGAVWNADESQILTWSNGQTDGILRIWDALTGETVLMLPISSRIIDARWNNEESLLSVVADRTVNLYPVYPNNDTHDFVEAVCKYATRNLTRQEWQQYFPTQQEEYPITCPNLPVHPSVLEN